MGTILKWVKMKKDITNSNTDELFERFGKIPNGSGFKNRARIHQGWWRMNVLNEMAGQHPINSNDNVCNTILNGEKSKNNLHLLN